MKHLRVIVNTHKRPAQALAVIETLRAVASGKHRVSYVLAWDSEDRDTSEYIFGDAYGEYAGIERLIPDDVTFNRKPRPASLQDAWNRNLTNPDDADIWLPMPDDGFCAAPEWDDIIVQTMAAAPRPDLAVIGWYDQANPDQFTVPIVTAGWLKAIAPEPLLDPRFPFWFSDTAISETWSYVFGMRAPCPKFLLLAGMPGKPNPLLFTEGGDKWWDLYAETRPARIELARRVREAHGLPRPANHALYVDAWTARDADGRRGTAELVEHHRAMVPA